MFRIIVTGAAGKMGKTNIKVVAEDKETRLVGAVAKLVGAVEAPGSAVLGMDAGLVAGTGSLGVAVVDSLSGVSEKADAIIDFSIPAMVAPTVEYAVKNNTALVIGTTGLGENELSIVREAGKTIPVIWSPNYSLGVSLMARLTRIAAEVLGEDFDPEIVETHHRLKKDAPSGTALRLLEVLKDVYQTEDVVTGREGITGVRPKKQIGVMTLRGGDVVGDHTVHFMGLGERIELTHRATSRETFARGALRAAKVIYSKGKGFYTMEQILGF